MEMLLAQVDHNSKAAHAGAICGIITAILICAAIPILTGLKNGRPGLGLIGGVVSGVFAYPFGLLGGLPAAIVFAVLIVYLENLEYAPKRKRRRPIDDDGDRPRRRRKRHDELEDEEDERKARRGNRASEEDRPKRRRRRIDEDDD
jgi:hypothetical protein